MIPPPPALGRGRSLMILFRSRKHSSICIRGRACYMRLHETRGTHTYFPPAVHLCASHRSFWPAGLVLPLAMDELNRGWQRKWSCFVGLGKDVTWPKTVGGGGGVKCLGTPLYLLCLRGLTGWGMLRCEILFFFFWFVPVWVVDRCRW